MVKSRVKIHNTGYAEILHWLHTNVGPTLHSQPIIFWHGEGWHMKTRNSSTFTLFFEVTFEDEKDAVWCELVLG